jgi:hypothetical protein
MSRFVLQAHQKYYLKKGIIVVIVIGIIIAGAYLFFEKDTTMIILSWLLKLVALAVGIVGWLLWQGLGRGCLGFILSFIALAIALSLINLSLTIIGKPGLF